MLLTTQRLLLRELTPDDFSALYRVLADSDIMQHYPYTFDEGRVRNWIQRNMERYQIFGFGLWAVVLRSTGEMIGDCGLTMQRIHDAIKPEIGYHILQSQQRQGYASEAAAACRDWAFTHTPFRRLYAYMKQTNTASRATAAAVGMHLCDKYLDEEQAVTAVYAISRSEWLAGRSGITGQTKI